MVSAENWCVKANDKVYGPYSSSQMRKYAHEGRLSATSLISPAGSREWREAGKESAFANFFDFGVISKKKKSDSPVFGKDADTKKAGAEVANFLIIFDAVEATASRVQAAILGLGHAFRVADNVWSLSCELTAVGVRNALEPYLASRESIFIVDATRGRTSWQNFPPALHSKISATYTVAKAAPLQKVS